MKKVNVRELNSVEIEEVNGGFVFTTAVAVSIVISAVTAGDRVGRHRDTRDNRND